MKQHLFIGSFGILVSVGILLFQPKTSSPDPLDLSRIRYEKGLELLRLLYEKVLGLDHHFNDLQTFREIEQLSNPLAFPEFESILNQLDDRDPGLLKTNPYWIAVSYRMLSKETRAADDLRLPCIIDFTSRMYTDLRLIGYETEYLRDRNRELLISCQSLFSGYVAMIDYQSSLEQCRASDDWEQLRILLENYMDQLRDHLQKNDPVFLQQGIKGQVELEFAVDRLLDFLEDYIFFIKEGSRYYAKFERILDNYVNESRCQEILPAEWGALKRSVEISHRKFQEAYSVTALKGSRLKDLLYGLSE